MNLALVHRHEDCVEVEHAGRLLVRYVYRPTAITPDEVPKPYFHPLKTLAGHDATNFRPHDHRWHQGLAMTMAQLSSQNFWGGATYVHGKGYVPVANQGTIRHESWLQMHRRDDAVAMQHRTSWINHHDERWLEETRTIGVIDCVPAEGRYTLDMTFALKNVSGQTLEFGSPTTEGRPNAGYGSLFWRGPREFDNGTILAAGDLKGPEIMGRSAAWLAYQSAVDGVEDQVTLIFMDHASNPRHPTKWFVRNTPYACASYSFMFDEIFPLPPGETLTLRYGLALIDDRWSSEQIDQYAASYIKSPVPTD